MMMIINDVEVERETLDQLADKRAWQLQRLDKIQSQLKQRVIEAYKNGEDTYNKKGDVTLSEWCMASVNNFLNIAEGINYNMTPSTEDIEKARKDLKSFDLGEEFTTTSQLYLETRKETIDHAISAHYRHF